MTPMFIGSVSWKVSMPSLEIDAMELTDVQVSHVSLVKRGAIRLPFKILKAEGDGAMINLSKIFKTDPSVPTVAAVLVNKAADLSIAKARLTKAGFQVETYDDTQDGVIIFPQVDELGDITPGDNGTFIMKMDEMLSCVLTGIEKSFEPINFDSTSFDEVLAQEGMRPGIHLSMDVLGATVSNILAKAEGRDEMVTDLTKTLDEFRDHVVSLAVAVPDTAFSVDFFKAADFPVAKTEGTDGEPVPVTEPVTEPVQPIIEPAATGTGTTDADAEAAAAAALADSAGSEGMAAVSVERPEGGQAAEPHEVSTPLGRSAQGSGLSARSNLAR